MNNFNGLIPVEFKALVLVDKPTDKSSGGIWIPPTAQEKQEYQADRGKLVAFNKGFWSNLPEPKPQINDFVIFNSYAGAILTINLNGERRKIRAINDKDIIAIIKEKENGQ